jgi:tRNA 2-thiouridine synthesizing protein A
MENLVLDLRGLRCPLPVLRAQKALRRMPVGGVLTVECTDPLTPIDIPHFVSEEGHQLISQEQRDATYIFRIAKLR